MATSSLLSFLSFLLLLFPAYNSPAETWDLNCGSSVGYTSYRGIEWISDYGYVHSGEGHILRNVISWGEEMSTLRSFPKGKKNCYSIPVGKGRKIGVVVHYLYGNYDGLESPPSFSVLFEDIRYGMAKTDMSLEHYYYMSFMYETPNGNASICLGRDYPSDHPIVNALQVIAFDPDMYREVNSSVVLRDSRRVAFGAPAEIGYPDDPYGRKWSPANDTIEGFKYEILVSNGTVEDTSAATDKPPAKIFTKAASPPDGTSSNLIIRINGSVSAGDEVYINLYFTEVSDLAGTEEKRSFHIYVNDIRLNHVSSPIVPPFNDVLEVSGVVKMTSDPKITLTRTPDSTLPPIISGMEILLIQREMLGMGTYSSNVEALKVLQDNFAVLQNWSGDPCLPKDYNWEWVRCSNLDMPRVTELHLDGYGLEGTLPDFSDLKDLIIIDLHDNNLSGSIPKFLAELPNLRELNVANNNFSDYPDSLKGVINVTGNPMLDTLPPRPDDDELPPSDYDGSPTGGREKISSSTSIIYYLLMMGFFALNMI